MALFARHHNATGSESLTKKHAHNHTVQQKHRDWHTLVIWLRIRQCYRYANMIFISKTVRGDSRACGFGCMVCQTIFRGSSQTALHLYGLLLKLGLRPPPPLPPPPSLFSSPPFLPQPDTPRTAARTMLPPCTTCLTVSSRLSLGLFQNSLETVFTADHKCFISSTEEGRAMYFTIFDIIRNMMDKKNKKNKT